MKSIDQISLLNPLSVSSLGDLTYYQPVIKGFSSEVDIANTPNGPAAATYLEVNLTEYSPYNDYQHRAILVEGYVRPLNVAGYDGSKRIGLPFTHYALLDTVNDTLLYDSQAEEHTPSSSPTSNLFSIFDIEPCWFPDPFTPSENVVDYDVSSTTCSFKLGLKGGSIQDKQYAINGIYYLI